MYETDIYCTLLVLSFPFTTIAQQPFTFPTTCSLFSFPFSLIVPSRHYLSLPLSPSPSPSLSLSLFVSPVRIKRQYPAPFKLHPDFPKPHFQHGPTNPLIAKSINAFNVSADS